MLGAVWGLLGSVLYIRQSMGGGVVGRSYRWLQLTSFKLACQFEGARPKDQLQHQSIDAMRTAACRTRHVT